jgi:hypothetical protein
MKHRTRIYFNAEQRADIWDRWQRGESMRSIRRLFERESSSIYALLQPSGGIRPPTRTRSRLRDFTWGRQSTVPALYGSSVEALAFHDQP